MSFTASAIRLTKERSSIVNTICDELWYIYVEDSIRKKRLKYARGYETKKIDEMFAAQLPKDMFMRHCDRVIDNSGVFEETKMQLDKIIADL